MNPDYEPCRRRPFRRAVFFAALVGALLWLSGCVHTEPAPAPDVRIDDAHGGGSIVAFNGDDTLLASGGWEGNIRLYALPKGEAVRGWQAHGDSVNGLQFLSSGMLLSAGYDGRLVRWNVDGTEDRSIATGAPITHMVANEARDRIVMGHNDGSVTLWRLDDLTLLERHTDHRGAVRAVAFDPMSGRIASSSTDGSVVVWDPDGSATHLPRPPTDAWSLVFQPGGKTLYGGGWFDLFRWGLSEHKLTVMDTEHRGIIKSLDFNAAGTAIASISRQTDSAVYFLDPYDGTVIRRFEPHDLCGGYIRLSGDERYLATTSDDASVRVWRLAP